MEDDLVPGHTGEVEPLVPVCMLVVETVLEDEVVTEVVIVAELFPHHNIIWLCDGTFICHHQMVVKHRSVIDVPENIDINNMMTLLHIYLQLVRYRTLQLAKSSRPEAVTKCLLVLSADQG